MSVLSSWIVAHEHGQVVQEVGADPEVVCASASILDRYLASSLSTQQQQQQQWMAMDLQQLVLCALSLACKMHSSDEANVATAKVMSLVLRKVPRPAMVHLEVEVSCRLDWHLNPPTSPVVIHHLATFLPHFITTNAMLCTVLGHHSERLALRARGGEAGSETPRQRILPLFLPVARSRVDTPSTSRHADTQRFPQSS